MEDLLRRIEFPQAHYSNMPVSFNENHSKVDANNSTMIDTPKFGFNLNYRMPVYTQKMNKDDEEDYDPSVKKSLFDSDMASD